MFKLEVDKDINLVFLDKSFAADLYALVDSNREYLGQWMPWVESTSSVEDIEAFIERSIVGFAKGETLVCGIEYQETLAGIISYNTISQALKKVILGYWVSFHLQGNSIISRSCNKLLEYAFDELKMEKVEIRVVTENRSSRSVCEKLGFSLEGTVTNAENLGGKIVNHAVYGLHKII